MGRIYSFFGGTCRFYAFLFTFMGFALALSNQLSGTYVALVGAIQALLVVHSVKEDIAERSGDKNGAV